MAKPTPKQIADIMSEDEFGLPVISQQGVGQPGHDGFNAGPEFDQGGGPAAQEHRTEMRSCAASGCSYNQDGYCTLEAIEINESGGCAQYEAAAPGSSGEDGGRYDELDTDVSGGVGSEPPAPRENTMTRHWDHSNWDPRGGGY